MAMRDAAERRDRQNKAMATGCVVLLLTAIAVPILVISAVVFSDERAVLNSYDAAPACAAGASAEASCKREVEYQVAFEDGHAGHDAAYYLELTSASGDSTRIQLENNTGVWPAASGETVTVTSWRGIPVSVSDGRYVSQLVGAPALQRGDGAYGTLWIAGAVYLYLMLIALVPRAAGPLLLVPAAALITGIALHGEIVGGPWTHDLLLFVFALPVVLFLIALVPKRRRRRG
jgi:hypothetical protein